MPRGLVDPFGTLFGQSLPNALNHSAAVSAFRGREVHTWISIGCCTIEGRLLWRVKLRTSDGCDGASSHTVQTGIRVSSPARDSGAVLHQALIRIFFRQEQPMMYDWKNRPRL